MSMMATRIDLALALATPVSPVFILAWKMGTWVSSFQSMISMTSIDHANLNRLDLNLLVAFDALLTERSVTRAAARIGLGQSAMSHNLARLRTLFGDELLTRGAEGMRPTPRALALADPVRITLAQIQAAVLQREAFDPSTADRVFRIGLADSIEVAVIPGLLARLRRIAPSVSLRLRSINRISVLEELDSGKLDLGIGVFDQGQMHHKRRLLYTDNFLCLFNPEQTHFSPPITLDDYLSVPHVLTSLTEDDHGAVDDALDERLAAGNLRLPDADAEQLLDEGVVGGRLEALAPHRLGDLQRGAADEAHGDGVDDPVGVADDDGDEGIEARAQRALLGRRDRPEQQLRVAQRALQRGDRVAHLIVERAQLVGERRGIGAEAAGVLADGDGQRGVEQPFAPLEALRRRDRRRDFDAIDLALGEGRQPLPVGLANDPAAARMRMLHEEAADEIVMIADAMGDDRVRSQQDARILDSPGGKQIVARPDVDRAA